VKSNTIEIGEEMALPTLIAPKLFTGRGGYTGGVTAFTVTELEPVAGLKVEALEELGVKAAVKVSVPSSREPAGMVMIAEPELNVVDAEA
jgi:hypothetical protein